MKQLKHKIMLVLAVAVSAVAVVAAPAVTPIAGGNVAVAQSEGQAQTGVNLAGNSDKTVDGLVGGVINILSWIVGVASVIMIIVAGLRYVTSGGDSGSISSAKNTIMYAIVGLVIALFAQAIVRFVLGRV